MTNVSARAIAAALGVACLWTVPAWAHPVAFDIPAQFAADAIRQFGRQARVQIVAPTAALSGIRTTAVRGSFERSEALRLLLAGSGLAVASETPDMVVLRAASPAAPEPARDDTAQPEQDIVVSGFRASIEDAIGARRAANGLTDSIFAKDVADFPDTNLAESIQRIPGVQITRDAGEGRQIAVRGLSGDFTRVRLNGMEALATTGTTDQRGGVNRSRSFDLNIFASDLFNRIDVIKSRSAALDEGGIGATVDLHTARPFDRPGFHVAGSVEGFYATSADKVGPRAALVISDTTDDGRWGALVSVAYSRRQVVEDGHQTLRWQSGGWTLGNVASTVDPAIRARLNGTGADRLFYPRTPRYFIFDQDQKRLGMTGAIQFRPSDALHINLDMLYARLKSTRLEYFLDAQSFSRTDAAGIRETTIRQLEVSGNDIVAADFGRVDNRSDNRRDQNDTKFHQVALSARWRPASNLTVDMLTGLEGSDYRVDTRTLQFTSLNNDFSYDYRGDDRVPVLNYGIAVDDPAAWRLDLYRPRINTVGNTYRIGKLDLAWDTGGGDEGGRRVYALRLRIGRLRTGSHQPARPHRRRSRPR